MREKRNDLASIAITTRVARTNYPTYQDPLLATFTAGTQMVMTAAHKLSPAIPNDDPLWRKFLAAPFDPNPPSEEELRWLEQAQACGVIDGASMSAEIARRGEHDGEHDVESKPV